MEMKLKINEKDFRVYKEQFDSKMQKYFCVCSTLIEGRWESYISFRIPKNYEIAKA